MTVARQRQALPRVRRMARASNVLPQQRILPGTHRTSGWEGAMGKPFALASQSASARPESTTKGARCYLSGLKVWSFRAASL